MYKNYKVLQVGFMTFPVSRYSQPCNSHAQGMAGLERSGADGMGVQQNGMMHLSAQQAQQPGQVMVPLAAVQSDPMGLSGAFAIPHGRSSRVLSVLYGRRVFLCGRISVIWH